MSDLIKAKSLLKGTKTCVLCKENIIFDSEERGILPLVKWHENDDDFNGFSSADKVVGAAAAFMYVLLGVKSVYADVMSERANVILKKHGIEAEYKELTTRIVNRKKDGFCPMETAVMDISEPIEAYKKIKDTLKNLQK